jgi:GT2 family glycosyltransferase
VQVAAIIVSRNTKDATLRCVRSVLSQDVATADITVLVVDNASTDGTADAVRAESGSRVAVLANERNVGFGAACNAGARAAPGAAWLLFLNADVVLDRDVVATLLAAAARYPKAAVLGPRFTFPGGRTQSSIRGDPTRIALLHQHTGFRYLRIGRFAYSEYKSPLLGAVPQESCTVPVTLGACMLIDAAAFRALGGFDERYFLYFEEADLQRRARDAGRVVVHVPRAHVVHEGGASSDGDRARALGWYLQSLFRYVDRFHGAGAGFLFRVAFKPLFVVKMLMDLVRDVFALALRRKAAKRPEIGLGVRFLLFGIWRFLVV